MRSFETPRGTVNVPFAVNAAELVNRYGSLFSTIEAEAAKARTPPQEKMTAKIIFFIVRLLVCRRGKDPYVHAALRRRTEIRADRRRVKIDRRRDRFAPFIKIL